MSDESEGKKPRTLRATPPPRSPRPQGRETQFDRYERPRPGDNDRFEERPPGEERARVFVGVPMPDAAQMALSKLQAELRERPELAWNVSWPKAAGLHITLQFLGEISPPRARLVGRVLEEIAAGFKPFTLDLFGVGAFPKAGRASILWAGVRSGAEVLCKFQRELETRLIQNGFAREEHVFEPHLTLVRLRMPADLRAVVRQYAKFGLAGIPVGSVHVMQSELLRGGAVYTPLSTAVLGSPTKSEQSA